MFFSSIKHLPISICVKMSARRTWFLESWNPWIRESLNPWTFEPANLWNNESSKPWILESLKHEVIESLNIWLEHWILELAFLNIYIAWVWLHFHCVNECEQYVLGCMNISSWHGCVTWSNLNVHNPLADSCLFKTIASSHVQMFKKHCSWTRHAHIFWLSSAMA